MDASLDCKSLDRLQYIVNTPRIRKKHVKINEPIKQDNIMFSSKFYRQPKPDGVKF